MLTRQAPLIIVSVLTPMLNAGIIMYGVNGGHGDNTPPNGDIVTVDQTTGAVTVLGPSGFPRLSGIGILPNNTIYASTLGGGGFPPGPGFVTTSDLLKVALNGAVLSDVGTIHVASTAGPTLLWPILRFNPAPARCTASPTIKRPRVDRFPAGFIRSTRIPPSRRSSGRPHIRSARSHLLRTERSIWWAPRR